MSELFYVTASGPARFSVSGRIYHLVGGESQGPFTKTEIDQVQHSSDKQRLHIVPFKGRVAAPVKPNTAVDQSQQEAPVKEEVDVLYKGTAEVTVSEPIPSNDVKADIVELNPKSFQPASFEEDATRRTPTQGDPIPDIEVDPTPTSSAQPMPTAEDVEEKIKAAATESVEDAPVKTRRSRRTKAKVEE